MSLYLLQTPLRLNLGGGDDHYEGYVNVDLREDVADVCADVRSLPVPDDSVSAIIAYDILEHLTPVHTLSALREWQRVLQPGGTLAIRTPNMLELCRWVVEGRQVGLAIQNIYGGHKFGPEGEWDCHHTGWTPAQLRDRLEAFGFEFVSDDEELNHTVIVRKPREVHSMVAPQDYKTVGVLKKSATTAKETQLDRDRAAYQRLRKQGLQPPRIDGCARLEKEAVTRDEIVMGAVQSGVSEQDRKRVAKERRAAFDRAKEITG